MIIYRKMVKTRKYKKRKKTLKGGLFGFGKKKNENTSIEGRKKTIKKKCGRGHLTTGNAKKIYEQLIKLKKEFGKVFYLGYGQKTSEVSSKTAKKAKKPEKYQNFFLVLPKRGTPIKGGLILWFCSTELDLETDPKKVKNISLGDFLLDHFNPNLKYYNGAMYITHDCIKNMFNKQGKNGDDDEGGDDNNESGNSEGGGGDNKEQAGGSNVVEGEVVEGEVVKGDDEGLSGPIKIALKGKIIKPGMTSYSNLTEKNLIKWENELKCDEEKGDSVIFHILKLEGPSLEKYKINSNATFNNNDPKKKGMLRRAKNTIFGTEEYQKCMKRQKGKAMVSGDKFNKSEAKKLCKENPNA